MKSTYVGCVKDVKSIALISLLAPESDPPDCAIGSRLSVLHFPLIYLSSCVWKLCAVLMGCVTPLSDVLLEQGSVSQSDMVICRICYLSAAGVGSVGYDMASILHV